MPDANDMDLVREFARHNSEAAFTELVRRHVNLVYSVARRCTGNDGDAQDVTQAVFIILARKAAGLREKTLLTGWLYETTRFTAARLLRTNARRHVREQEAYMQSTLNEANHSEVWEKLAPHLETAMGKLNAADRALLVLRFYENKSGPETAALLGIREDAAHKRVARAIEKLRKVFAQRGVAFSGAAIAGAVSANSVQAAPVALVKTISAIAAAKGVAATTSTLTFVKGALKIMAWTKMKTAIVVGVGALLAIATATVTVRQIEKKNLSWADDQRIWASAWSETDIMTVLHKIPPAAVLIRPTRFPDKHSNLDSDFVILGNDFSITNILDVAYRSLNPRDIIMPTDIPQGRYDYLLRGDHLLTPAQRKPLQNEIKKQFGLVAHTEMRDTDVLLLEVKVPNHPGIKLGTDTRPRSIYTARSFQKDETEIRSGRLGAWALMLNDYCDLPVLDRTHLTGRYDLFLKWKPDGDDKKVEREIINAALLDQLGLELVPGSEPMETLVAEKVK